MGSTHIWRVTLVIFIGTVFETKGSLTVPGLDISNDALSTA
jgi:hypothetical protein